MIDHEYQEVPSFLIGISYYYKKYLKKGKWEKVDLSDFPDLYDEFHASFDSLFIGFYLFVSMFIIK